MENLRNETKTRWGDSVNLLYCGHIINKRRRSYVYSYIYNLNIIESMYFLILEDYINLERPGKRNLFNIF